jgi:hypothetical protein
MGKLCSRISERRNDDGGEDRFLLPAEEAVFRSCIKNPPFYEGGTEYGLTNAYEAVKRHLPRKKNAPDKIRKDAQLAVIIVTDEAPQELKKGGELLGRNGFLDFNDYRSDSCLLSKSKQADLARFIAPVKQLLRGATDPEAEAMVHLIGGICGNDCNADMAHGYRDLARALGGQVGDVCQKNLRSTLRIIIDNIVAAASPRVLAHTPISSTLAVEAQGVRLQRRRHNGYMYNAATNSLTFHGVDVRPGHEVVVAYRRFNGSN